MQHNTLAERDLSVIWHPCTQMKDHEKYPIIPIARAQGVWLYDTKGNEYIDAISSWWVNLFGHNHPRLIEAITEQAHRLSHVMFAGFTHEPAIVLAEKLKAIVPLGLTRCFFADTGSSAVEVALKMSYQFWQNQGKPNKKRFVHLSNSYHGETIGALSVSDVPLYKSHYADLLFDTITVKSPDCFYRESGESWEVYSMRSFDHMQAVLDAQGDEIAAVIIEPLVQCAGGMRMYDPVYLKLLHKACKAANVHVIADEIAVGFGRTGTMFAYEQAGISPDFMCLSKGITGGMLALSVVMTQENIYQAFYDDYDKLKAFLHSHSYTGNPLACAAAVATLTLFEETQIISKNITTAKRMGELLAPLNEHPHVAEVRQSGMIIAAELVQHKATKTPYAWQERRGMQLYEYALTRGVVLRPLGNVVYAMPPYVINDDELCLIAKTMMEGIDLITRE